MYVYFSPYVSLYILDYKLISYIHMMLKTKKQVKIKTSPSLLIIIRIPWTRGTAHHPLP